MAFYIVLNLIMYSFPLECITDLDSLLAYNNVEYGIPVDAEALEMESNVIGSSPALDIVIGEPRTIGLNPNIAFSSLTCNCFFL